MSRPGHEPPPDLAPRRRRSARPWRVLAAVAGSAAVALGIAAGCGNDATDAAVPELRVVAREDTAAPAEGARYHFELPAQVPAGAVRMALQNAGGELHHA